MVTRPSWSRVPVPAKAIELWQDADEDLEAAACAEVPRGNLCRSQGILDELPMCDD